MLSEADERERQKGFELCKQRLAADLAAAGMTRAADLAAGMTLSSFGAEIIDAPLPDNLSLVNFDKNKPADYLVKVWPGLLIGSLRCNAGGAARVWSVAKSLDCSGSGWVCKADLFAKLADLGANQRNIKRWLSQAVDIGLIIAGGKGRYSLVSLGKAAVILKVDHIGRAVVLDGAALFSNGWRARVWSGVLAGTNNRPISQAKLCELTGVDERTQRNYKKAEVVEVRRNYAKTNLGADHVQGFRDAGRESTFAGDNNKLFFRLPDQYNVPRFVADLRRKGRLRKAQRLVNDSSKVGRVKCPVVRLFHDTSKAAEGAAKVIRKADVAVWEDDYTLEVFVLNHAGKRSNLYNPLVLAG